MTPGTWKRMIGEAAWTHLLQATDGFEVHEDEAALAALLTKASELGFVAPAATPTIDPEGTKLLWPGGLLALTAEGLRRFWAAKGHGFFLLRADVLLRAVDGPLLPRLQEILQGYIEQAEAEGREPIPGFANLRVFVGGEIDPADPVAFRNSAATLLSGLTAESPKPEPVQRAHVAHPGAKPVRG